MSQGGQNILRSSMSQGGQNDIDDRSIFCPP
jgi:hypothetical protein